MSARSLLLHHGERLPVGSGSARGFVESVEDLELQVCLGGWALSPDLRPVEQVLLARGDEVLGEVRPSRARPDVSTALGLTCPDRLGFRLQVPAPLVEDPGDLAVYAHLGDSALPLRPLRPQLLREELPAAAATVTRRPLVGLVDHVHHWPGGAEIAGWALSPRDRAPFEEIRLCYQGEPLDLAREAGHQLEIEPWARVDIGERFAEPTLVGAGFRLVLTHPALGDDWLEGLELEVTGGGTRQRLPLPPPIRLQARDRHNPGAMMVNDQYRFGFAHLPKTGGTFVTRALRKLPGNRLQPGTYLHASVLPARRANPGYFFFTLVRNPFDWYVSFFEFLKASQRRGWSRDFFPEFVRSLCTPATAFRHIRWASADAHAEPGSAGEAMVELRRGLESTRLDVGWMTARFLLSAHRDLPSLLACRDLQELGARMPEHQEVDAVIRLEHLAEELPAAFEEAGIQLPEEILRRIRSSERVNVTRRGPYREYYDDGLRELVTGRDALMLERFEYAF